MKPGSPSCAIGCTTPSPRLSARPVHPFSVNCEFDRQRGQFVVHAGARAGACALVTCAALAVGTFAYVRSALCGGPAVAAAATLPAERVTTTTTPKLPRMAATEPVVARPAKSSNSSFAKAAAPRPAPKPVAVKIDDPPASAAESPKHHEPAPTTEAVVKTPHAKKKKSTSKSEGQRA
jgi:hypothetical protein